MNTQGITLAIIAIVLLLFMSVYLFAFIYDYLVSEKLKKTWFKKFDDWWESLAWNSGQW